jgi:hypothetical protein
MDAPSMVVTVVRSAIALTMTCGPSAFALEEAVASFHHRGADAHHAAGAHADHLSEEMVPPPVRLVGVRDLQQRPAATSDDRGMPVESARRRRGAGRNDRSIDLPDGERTHHRQPAIRSKASQRR